MMALAPHQPSNNTIGDTMSRKKLETDLTEYSSTATSSTGPYAKTLDVDVLVVGAAGIFMLKTLRECGLRTVIYEAGTDLGGTWHWNCYPGARVDSEVPEYEFSWPEVWKTWNWTTNYPTYNELRLYFDHVDKIVHIKKDCAFKTVVIGAQFDIGAGRWHVNTADGRVATSKYLVIAAGFASKRYIPDWPGIDKFRGIVHHSSFWPNEQVDVSGKRCGIIGTGASGVQIAQEWGPLAGELRVFQRTPNLTLPMKRRELSAEEQERGKMWYPKLFELREKCFAGFLYDFNEKSTFDDDVDERKEFYAKLWNKGGFAFWLETYKDSLLDARANREAYDFWTTMIRPRIHVAKKRDLLAPLDMPHFFGVKRPCLEQSYYEQFNRPNVDVVDVKANPIKEFTETGLTLTDGEQYELDVVAIATGFDINTGGMANMGLTSIHNTSLHEEWKASANTYLGTTISGYPNMFHLYGTHGPTALSNGPTAIEVQGRWIADCITKMERQGIKYIDATKEAMVGWKSRINALNNGSLLPTTHSTYMGGCVPGKAFEPVNYTGGMVEYKMEIRRALDGWVGYEVVKE